jgi:sugar phosphate isomerase/epimerase
MAPIEDQQDFKRLLPGDGMIDIPGFLAALQTAGYTGAVSMEVFNEDLKKLPAAEAAKRACEAGRKFPPFSR